MALLTPVGMLRCAVLRPAVRPIRDTLPCGCQTTARMLYMFQRPAYGVRRHATLAKNHDADMMLRLRQHTYDAGIRRQWKWCQQLCAALAACSITCCGRLMPTAVGLTQWLQAARTCTTHTLPYIHTLLAHHAHCHAIEAFQSWQAPGQLPAPHQLVAPIN